MRDAIAALRASGIILAAAAGNDNNDVMPLYPASYDFDNIIAVAAYDLGLGATVYVGLAVTSHDNSQLNTATFSSSAVR